MGRVVPAQRGAVWMALTQSAVRPGDYDAALTNAFGRSPVDPTQANWPGNIYMVRAARAGGVGGLAAGGACCEVWGGTCMQGCFFFGVCVCAGHLQWAC